MGDLYAHFKIPIDKLLLYEFNIHNNIYKKYNKSEIK